MSPRIILMFFFALCFLFAFPVNAVFYEVYEDTFTVTNSANGIIQTFDIVGNVNLSSVRPYGNLSVVDVYNHDSGAGSPLNLNALFKWNNTNVQSVARIINSTRIVYDVAENDCGSSFSAYLYDDDSWNEHNVTGANRSAIVTANKLTGRNATGHINHAVLPSAGNGIVNSSQLFIPNISNANLINDIYTDSFTSVIGDNTVGTCGAGVGNRFTVFSKNYTGATAINISFNLDYTDYLSGTYNNTDIPSSGFITFDHETGTQINGSSFTAQDWAYDPFNNALVPNNGVKIAIAAAETSIENDLSTQISKCFSISSYNTDTNSPNPYPNVYNYYCFNLSSRHNNQTFFGMIKVINNSNVRGGTNPEFDYYWATTDGLYNTFTPPILLPDPAQLGLNLTVRTFTTRDVNVTMYYRVNSTGTFGAYQLVIEGTQVIHPVNFYQHDLVINYAGVISGNYEVYFIGNASGVTFQSSTYNFSVATPFTNPPPNSTPSLERAAQALVDNGTFADTSSALWFFGAIVLVFTTGVAAFFGGFKLAVVVGTTAITVLALVGFFPAFILIPVLLIATALIVKWARGTFMGGN